MKILFENLYSSIEFLIARKIVIAAIRFGVKRKLTKTFAVATVHRNTRVVT